MQRVAIITPALADANNGNWHTARRWAMALGKRVELVLEKQWSGTPVDAMIALHARRSAQSIAAFHATGKPCAVVMTGTDLYRDIHSDPSAQRSMDLAKFLVVLQEDGVHALPPFVQHKTRVIYQSAVWKKSLPPRKKTFDWAMVGHARPEKDPLTALRALQMIPKQPGAPSHRLLVAGRIESDSLGQAMHDLARRDSRIVLLGGLTQSASRNLIARSRALLLPSLMEGGANVLIEAVRCGGCVLASRISGSVGMLGKDYGGYFETGNPEALARLMQQVQADAKQLEALRDQCAARAHLFDPQQEALRVLDLVNDLLQV